MNDSLQKCSIRSGSASMYVCVLCILSAAFKLRALLYVLCAFLILNKEYLVTTTSVH